ncbi:aldehyde dehydrogenase family protein [Rhodovulum tesquicola]|uniref:aldehyde dehydrogenase family protein n=1 Tax=Rhodovulum tesquicola TaxID=540254 RepID=UPI002097C965|nr:aldehyde dehydrogenase family protein [Rhodovulum tesquicola]MCO8145092.1 aldehyde dehydrogenase family protein [Rhodovulum tesquicola]
MSVSELMQTMDYGPAPESPAEALDWLAGHGNRFGLFIAGRFTEPRAGVEARNPATGEGLAMLTAATPGEVEDAVAAARQAQPKWAGLGGAGRARHLRALARLIRQRARLIAVLETLDSGQPIRESREMGVALAERLFHHHAGLAQLLEQDLPGEVPLGVCGLILPSTLPFVMLASMAAPALAAGNTIVLKPAERTSLGALLFADLARVAGLPRGVVNVVTGGAAVGEAMVAHPGIDGVGFAGSAGVGRAIRAATAGSGKALGLHLSAKPPVIVFEDADLDAAVEGAVEAMCSRGPAGGAGARLILQEGIAGDFLARLKARMAGLRLGGPLDKCTDIGALIDEGQRDHVAALVAEGAAEGDLFQPDGALPERGAFHPPTLVSGLAPASRLMQAEVFGPVLVSTTFRTPTEAVQMANDARHGQVASVWSETITLALDVAAGLAAGVVRVNGANLVDAAGVGGLDGLTAYLRPEGRGKRLKPPAPPRQGDPLARAERLWIGGRRVPPSGGQARAIHGPRGQVIGHVGLATREDVHAAVAAARKAQPGWATQGAQARAQVLCTIAEALSARAGEVADLLRTMTGGPGAKAEVAQSVERLFTWAGRAGTQAGEIRPGPTRGTALAMAVPLGVIGALCPDEAPLLGLVSVLAPAIAMGNACVLVPSEPCPLAAAAFCEVLEASDLPGGVVNLLTGAHAALAEPLAAHMDVDAVWSFSSADLSAGIERAAAGDLKRSWVNHGRARDWWGAEGEDRAFLRAATDVRTILIPWGA